MLFVLLVKAGLWMGLTRARDLILDSAPILAWRRADPDAAFGHAPARHPCPLLLGYRLHTLLCRGTGLPLLFLLSPANVHDAPFAHPLLELAVQLFGLHPRVVPLDAGYWGLKLITWIHTVLGA
jgi:DDE family transposase